MNNDSKISINSNQSNKIVMKYPKQTDMNFQKKIALKKEFNILMQNDKIKILNKEDKSCIYDSFTLAPHQEFVKMFISRNTPYNGLLLYHGMGSGKTCSAIGITEEYRKYFNKYNKNFKKIMIIASPNVQDNFKLQLFNEDKLEKKNGIWNLDGCVGEALLKEINFLDIQNLSKKEISVMIQRIIKKNYQFIGYQKFGKIVNNILEKGIVWIKKYNKEGQIIIEKGEKNNKGEYILDNKKNYKYFEKKNKDNDGYSVTKYSAYLQKMEVQKFFKEKMIVVDEVHNIRNVSENDSMKLVAEAFNSILKYVRYMKLLFLSGTPMYNDPKEIIFIINLLNRNDGQSTLKQNEIFDSEGNFKKDGEQKLLLKCNGYISYVRSETPYKFPFKIFPNDFNSEKSIKNINYPLKQFNNLNIDVKIQHLDIYCNELSSSQQKAYQEILFNSVKELSSNDKYESMESFKYFIFQEPLNALTFSFYDEETGKSYSGKQAFEQIMNFDKVEQKYDYINPDNRIFSYENINNYSSKIKSILDCIKNSDGIILIYSQYLESGLIPMAIALEEMGYKRSKVSKTGDILKNKPTGKNTTNYYSMITGDLQYSKSNKEEIQYLNKLSNKDGKLCKVVLISQAGSEGIDFKYLRQVHIIEPWYNLNRTDQIIGRAIRDCSHKDLPIHKRNCQIFLHTSFIENGNECVDMMLYRLSELKAQKIGKVQKLLKSISVDCLLNKNQQKFSKTKQVLEIELSNKLKINFNIKDKPYSSICDYNTCSYQCYNNIENENIDDHSYSIDHISRNHLIKKIKKLFLKNHLYKEKDIFDLLKTDFISKDNIYEGLNYLLNNKNEYIIDKNGRKGTLVNVKDLYLFQPFETSTILTLQELQKNFIKKKNSIPIIMYENNTNKLNNIENDRNNSVNNLRNYNNNESVPQQIDNVNNKTFDNIKKKISYIFNNNVNNTLNEKIKNNIKFDEAFYVRFYHIIDTIEKTYNNFKDMDKFARSIVISHIIETLFISQELELINYIYNLKIISKNSLEYEIKTIYDKYILKENDKKIIFLVNLKEKSSKKKEDSSTIKSHINTYIFKNSKWRIITNSEKREIGYDKILTFLRSFNTNNDNLYGFREYSSKLQENVLKTAVNLDSGAFFHNKTPKDMKEQIILLLKMNNIDNQDDKLFNNLGTTNTKYDCYILMEILLKYFYHKNNINYLHKIEYATLNLKN